MQSRTARRNSARPTLVILNVSEESLPMACVPQAHTVPALGVILAWLFVPPLNTKQPDSSLTFRMTRWRTRPYPAYITLCFSPGCLAQGLIIVTVSHDAARTAPHRRGLKT